MYSSDEVEKILNDNNGKDYVISVKRGEEYKTFRLSPVYLENEGCYKAGMWCVIQLQYRNGGGKKACI